MDTKTLVFVYGSLREGMGLDKLYMQTASPVAITSTVDDHYCMFDIGSIPIVVKTYDTYAGYRIRGEVYEVDEVTLDALDRVERGYERTEVMVEGLSQPVHMYIYPHLAFGSLVMASKDTPRTQDWVWYNKEMLDGGRYTHF